MAKSFDVPKDIKYIILPFFGHGSYMLRNKLSTLLKSYFPQCNIRFILCNRKSIGSIFPVKESLPARLCSNIIYQFTCENCSSSYVGSTIRTLHERVNEHMGKSFLTGSTLSSPKASSIREHSNRTKHPLRADNFKIIGRSMPSDHIRLLESVYIRYLNPDLNDLESAMPLNIIWLVSGIVIGFLETRLCRSSSLYIVFFFTEHTMFTVGFLKAVTLAAALPVSFFKLRLTIVDLLYPFSHFSSFGIISFIFQTLIMSDTQP